MCSVVDSVHTPDGLYCVDVVRHDEGYVLCTCRRDEGSWQVVRWHAAVHPTREGAIAAAAARVHAL